jgi:D-proline reductase (dithiol) PrdB
VSTPPPGEQPPLTIRAFADSLFHGERADNYFKFLKNFSEPEIDSFFQELLREVGDAVDTGDAAALARFVQQAQARAYKPAPGASQRPSQMLQLAAPVPLPQARLNKPLSKARVALFTTGAIYVEGLPPFYPADWTYEYAVRQARTFFERQPALRLIPRETPVEQLRVGHIAYDIRAAQRDINVMLPLERFRELEAAGDIGELAPHAYSFHGLTNVPRLRDEFAPQWAQNMLQEGVDAVFLTPG